MRVQKIQNYDQMMLAYKKECLHFWLKEFPFFAVIGVVVIFGCTFAITKLPGAVLPDALPWWALAFLFWLTHESTARSRMTGRFGTEISGRIGAGISGLYYENTQQCDSCGGVGDDRRMLPGKAIFGAEGFHHGLCVVSRLTEAELLTLPPSATERLRLSETGVSLMRKLLDRIHHSGIGEGPPGVKLTAKQQEVVDRLRDGWMLHVHGYFKPVHRSLIEPESIGCVVHHAVRVSLREKGVIVHDFRSDHYYLTSSYK